MPLRPILLVSLVVLPLAGCGDLRLPWQKAAPGAPAAAEATGGTAHPRARPASTMPVAPQTRAAAAFDRTTEAERAAARAAPAGGTVLGKTVVSLGNPAEQGFWLATPLVTAPRPGTVRTAGGASVQVDLRPAAGGASQLSLAAFRALDLALTALPELTVLAR
ncbi:hypothetical protein [Ruixingdingia sedimenti]|uniref:D-galactarate dehydratase n=1 Tax=Ruixingdingia sedimenti TaxID=3073604 RepID=A0ABU1F8F2_9RHOB|nr:hypothetical protein [Xinfangfangia sp. LG-4]MDR5652888.1 hypothetical protein [Xinfangfangia sp. LG-4]